MREKREKRMPGPLTLKLSSRGTFRSARTRTRLREGSRKGEGEVRVPGIPGQEKESHPRRRRRGHAHERIGGRGLGRGMNLNVDQRVARETEGSCREANRGIMPGGDITIPPKIKNDDEGNRD